MNFDIPPQLTEFQRNAEKVSSVLHLFPENVNQCVRKTMEHFETSKDPAIILLNSEKENGQLESTILLSYVLKPNKVMVITKNRKEVHRVVKSYEDVDHSPFFVRGFVKGEQNSMIHLNLCVGSHRLTKESDYNFYAATFMTNLLVIDSTLLLKEMAIPVNCKIAKTFDLVIVFDADDALDGVLEEFGDDAKIVIFSSSMKGSSIFKF